ncbi:MULTISPECIES: hypothetical protein [Acinetobacter]|uniref:COG4648 family protein n=1 Tax=Acinetobacter TaxID=469 RepID=UPI00037BE55F|nr:MULTISPECIES: hypothetical protein [Acinetobacter]MCO8060052.1 Clp protease [Acinetobacter towneri]MCO8065702.1 Clp protease [Acinetobacter towneri]MDV2454145.1 Clp protease [Acinetobacter towneri]PCN60105.1 Clp protease [Acinetobacter sp. YT-02]
MKNILKGVVVVGLTLYPFFVAYALTNELFIWVSVLLIALGFLRLLSKGNTLLWPLTGFAILCGALSLTLKEHIWLKLYPVFMSLGALFIFAGTLIKPPSMIERFARLVEPELPSEGVRWTYQVTKVWCVFFGINAVIALITVFFAPMEIWVLYNGLISYLLMGILLIAEFILRKRHQQRHQTRK